MMMIKKQKHVQSAAPRRTPAVATPRRLQTYDHPNIRAPDSRCGIT